MVLDATERANMFELTTSWEEAGLARGREEEGLRLVSRLLRRRLGPPPGEAEAGLRGLSPEQLEELAEALLDFTAWNDLASWLRAHV